MNIPIRIYIWWILLSGLLTVSSAKGQITPSTAFYWENPYYINPAFVNTDASAYFSLSARKQWFGLSGSPVTVFGTGTYYWEKYKMQAGIKLLNDKIGYLNSTDLSFSYAYTLRFRGSFLSVGLSLGYQLQKADRGDVMIEDETDPALDNLLGGKKQWNGGLGVEYIVTPSFRIGLSTQHLFSFSGRRLQSSVVRITFTVVTVRVYWVAFTVLRTALRLLRQLTIWSGVCV